MNYKNVVKRFNIIMIMIIMIIVIIMIITIFYGVFSRNKAVNRLNNFDLEDKGVL